jgi:ATP-binding cassette subfamily G (WHITE) protein 2 (PDR)
LTAVTNPQERQAKKGLENKVPRTPEDFEKYWRDSPEYKALQEEIRNFDAENLADDGTLEQLRQQKNYIQVRRIVPSFSSLETFACALYLFVAVHETAKPSTILFGHHTD